jgi:hypothetical protein
MTVNGNTATTVSFKVDRTKYDINTTQQASLAAIGDKAISDDFELAIAFQKF